MQATPPPLKQQLEAFRAAFFERLPEEERAVVQHAELALTRALREHPAIGNGDIAPDFSLPDQHGTMIRLSERLRHGPVILLFIRGGWCPFCTLTLRAYQTWLPRIHDAGGHVLAVTPQPASTCCLMAERDLLAFPTLSDQNNIVAKSYGLGFEVDPVMRPLYHRLDHDLPVVNQTGDWVLPLPATLVIGTSGKVAFTHIKPRAHERLDPSDALAVLTRLAFGSDDA